MEEISQTVSAYQHPASQSDHTNLKALHARLRHCVRQLEECNARSDELSIDPSPHALAHEALPLVSAFARLCTALLSKLDRALWTGQEAVHSRRDFDALFGVLHDACAWYASSERAWPAGTLSGKSELFPALQSLTSFLMSLTFPGNGQLPWASPLGRALTAKESQVMLIPVLSAFNNICEAYQSDSLLDSIRSLPPAFINTLCYLACETFDSSLRSAPVAHMFSRLTICIAICATKAYVADEDGDIAPLRTPAIIEVSKRGYLAAHRPKQQPLPTLQLDMVRQLLALLYRDKPKAPVSPNMATRPKLTPSVTTPEHVILRILCKGTVSARTMVEMDCLLMLAVMQSWPRPQGRDLNLDALQNLNSVLHIARFCSAYMGNWMQAQQQQQQRGQTKQLGVTPASTTTAMPLESAMKVVQCVMLEVCVQAFNWESSGERLKVVFAGPCVWDLSRYGVS